MTLEQNLATFAAAVGQDVKRLTADVATKATVIASGPFTLDPKRAPVGSIVAVPEGAPTLTHTGSRFAGATGALPTTTTTYDTAPLRRTGTGTATFEAGGTFGQHLAVTAAGSDMVQATWTPLPPAASLLRDVQFSWVVRLPRPASDVTIIGLNRTGGTALTVLVAPGAAGQSRLIVNDQSTAGWEYQSPDFLSSATVRIAVAARYVDGTGTSALRVGFFLVGVDGAETQIGQTFLNSAVAIDGTSQQVMNTQFGRLSANAGTEGTYRLDAYRVAYGPGAYDIGFLQDERLYPAPVAV